MNILIDKQSHFWWGWAMAAKRDAKLQTKLKLYNAKKATFDERVKAFQAKVLALTV